MKNHSRTFACRRGRARWWLSFAILSPGNLPRQLSPSANRQAFRYVNVSDHHHKNSSALMFLGGARGRGARFYCERFRVIRDSRKQRRQTAIYSAQSSSLCAVNYPPAMFVFDQGRRDSCFAGDTEEVMNGSDVAVNNADKSSEN